MTTYYAAVKYDVSDTPAQKRRELEEGIGFVVALLMDEHGATAVEIEDLLRAAIDYAADLEVQAGFAAGGDHVV